MQYPIYDVANLFWEWEEASSLLVDETLMYKQNQPPGCKETCDHLFSNLSMFAHLNDDTSLDKLPTY